MVKVGDLSLHLASSAGKSCFRSDVWCGRWEPLGGCDVAWRPVDGGFDGAMADPGGCVVLSQRDGTTRVRVKDALALRDDVLEVDDRGYALDGTLLYGSPDGGPYRLARVQGTRDQGGDP